MGGLQTLITVLGRFDTYKRRVRIKLIIYQICIKTMSVKGGVYAHEAYEADFFFSLCEYMEPTSLLFISVLLNKSSSNSAYYIHAIVL